MTRRVAALVLAAGLAAGCAQDGLLFRQDRRVRIDAPTRNEKLSLPVTVRWSLRPGESRTDEIRGYAVFFDTEPQAPGQTLAQLGRRDPICERTPGCPDPAYLAARGIFQTSETSLLVDRLRPAGNEGRLRGADQPHEVTVVALDGEGRRLNEAAWTRRFVVERDQS